MKVVVGVLTVIELILDMVVICFIAFMLSAFTNGEACVEFNSKIYGKCPSEVNIR